MKNLLLRTLLLILHSLLNFFIISYIVDYDITGSWLRVILFSLLFITLLCFFILHIIWYSQFVKSK